jgi:exosortase
LYGKTGELRGELMATTAPTSRTAQPDHQVPRERVLAFLLLCLLPLVLAFPFLGHLSVLFLDNETYSHIPLIPLVTMALIWGEKQFIFSQLSSGWKSGSALLIGGAAAIGAGRLGLWQASPLNLATLITLGIVMAWVGFFLLAFGTVAFRKARFALLFLIFAIPMPEPVIATFIQFLRVGTTWASALIFRVIHVPFSLKGFEFALPGMAVEVTEDCSGIRSTIVLFILTVLVSHFALKSTWKKILICFLVIPFSLFKNGLRVATLSVLAVYVDSNFMYGRLHKFGGFVFFAAAFFPVLLALFYLRKTEQSPAT